MGKFDPNYINESKYQDEHDLERVEYSFDYLLLLEEEVVYLEPRSPLYTLTKIKELYVI